MVCGYACFLLVSGDVVASAYAGAPPYSAMSAADTAPTVATAMAAVRTNFVINTMIGRFGAGVQTSKVSGGHVVACTGDKAYVSGS